MLCSACNSFVAGWSATIKTLPRNENGAVIWAAYSQETHNSIASLRASSDDGCTICRNAWSTLSKHKQAAIAANTSVVLEVAPDQNKPILKAVYQRPDGTKLSRMLALFVGIVDDSEILGLLSKIELLDKSSTSSTATFELAKFWLHRCLEKHGKCPKPTEYLPTRVLDVVPKQTSADGSVRLVETTGIDSANNTFVALSHCWGKERFLTTTTSNLEAHKKEIKLEALPPSFRDAVNAVRELGYKYLWIDSLCIIQDSAEDWAHESARMCDVYAQAVVTLFSAHADSAFGGMFVQRDGIRTMAFNIELKTNDGPMNLMYVPTPQREVQWSLGDLPIYTRAWCYQEAILSTRSLIYDPHGIRWDCIEKAGGEGFLEAESMRNSRTMKAVQDAMKVADTATDFFERLAAGDIVSQAGYWQLIMSDYADRDLTKMSDKLIAVAGVAQAIQDRTKNEYLAGLWRDHLFTNLTWYVPSQAELKANSSRWAEKCKELPHRAKDSIAPSWSWASLEVPVKWDSNGLQQPFCEFLDAKVEGPPHLQTGTITIRGDTRELYVLRPDNSRVVALLKAAAKYKYMDSFNQSRGLIDQYTMMLASTDKPSRLTRSQILPVSWSPEDVWDEDEPLTFVATSLNPVMSGMSLELARQRVYTLALVPTSRAPDEYRRVGLAVWQDCSWFGTDCAADRQAKSKTWRQLDRSWLMSRSATLHEVADHQHPIQHDLLPAEGVYHVDARMVRKVLKIV